MFPISQMKYGWNQNIPSLFVEPPFKPGSGPLGVPGPRLRSLQASVRYAGATLGGLGTQLTPKKKPGVKPRSRFEFVVTAAAKAKQEFTEHTG